MAMIQVYITKYALTAGILLREVEEVERAQSMISWCNSRGYREYLHGEGKNWHRTWESALQCAEAMRAKRIKSLEKSLKALQALVFEEQKG